MVKEIASVKTIKSLRYISVAAFLYFLESQYLYCCKSFCSSTTRNEKTILTCSKSTAYSNESEENPR